MVVAGLGGRVADLRVKLVGRDGRAQTMPRHSRLEMHNSSLGR